LQQQTGRLEKPSRIHDVRKIIARIETEQTVRRSAGTKN
jgi:ribosomal protein L29